MAFLQRAGRLPAAQQYATARGLKRPARSAIFLMSPEKENSSGPDKLTGARREGLFPSPFLAARVAAAHSR